MPRKVNYLHLEDEQTIVDVTKHMLEKEGYEIETRHVQTREAFLGAIENHNLDMVLAGYSLPEFDGLTALKLLRERDDNLPFILISGSIGEEKAIESLRDGATDYVLKQNIQALPPVVERALTEAQSKKEKLLAEEALRSSEELYRSTIQNIPLAVLNLDTNGVIKTVNNSFTKIFGISDTSVTNKMKIEALQPFIDAGISHYFSDLIAHNTTFDFESPLLMSESGEPLYLRCRGIANKDKNGKTISFLVLLGDITQRVMMNKANQNLGRILDNSLNELYIFRADNYQFLLVNRGARENLGYTDADYCQLTPIEVKPELSKEDFEQLLQPLRQGLKQKINFTTVHQRKDGSRYPVEVLLQLTSYLGQPAFIAMINDVSALSKALSQKDDMVQALQEATDIINRSPAVAFLWKNADGWPVEYVSENVRKLFGHSSTDFMTGKIPYPEVVHPDDLERVGSEVSQHSSCPERTSFTHEPYRVRTKDGAIKWVNDITYIRRDQTGKITHYEGVVFDITERKEIENRIYQLSRSVEQSPSSTVITDLEGNIQYVNPKFCQVTGYTTKEALGKNPRVLKSGEMNDEAYKKLWNTITAGKVWRGRFHNKKKNGELFWEDATISPIKNDQGETIHYLAVKEDVTEHKMMQDKFEREHKLNSLLLNSLPHPAMIISKDRKVMALNKIAEQTGVTVGAYCWEEFGKCNYIPKKNEQEYHASGRILPNTYCYFCRADSCLTEKNVQNDPEVHAFDRIWDTYWIAINDELYLHYALDITERLNYESQLAHTQKLQSIGQLAAGIAHEINTPAQYVGDNTHFLQDSFNDLMKLFNVFNTMQESSEDAERLTKLLTDAAEIAQTIDLEFLLDEIPVAINQALDGIGKVGKIVKAMKEFSHPGTSEKSLVDLNRAINNTIMVCRNEWKYAAEMHTDFDEALAGVPCFPDEFNQVILNMIINAAHAIEEKFKGQEAMGQITIQTGQKENMAEIRISDSGTGMTETIRKKVFDPFFTTKEVGRGTGQGLAISYDVITNKHGGTIDVESKPGRGTTFIIRLPLES